MKRESKIELINQNLNEVNFNVDYNYKYEFTVNSGLKRNDLIAHGFVEDLIAVLKEDFEMELRGYLHTIKTKNE